MSVLEVQNYLDFSSFSRGEFTLGAVVIVLCYVSVFIVCMVDVRSAIRRDKRFAVELAMKAIKEGKESGSLDDVVKKLSPKLNSWGIRRTFAKLKEYYMLLFSVGFPDVLLLVTDVWGLMHIAEVPYLSMALSIAFIGNELFSIWENSPKRDKENVVKSLRQFRQMAKDLSQEISSDDIKELRQLLSEIRDNQVGRNV